MASKIGVLVVDDSAICRQLIADALVKDGELEVVGMAKDGREAVELVKRLHPQVITMDVEMPVMDGLSATEEIMAEHPTPILMLTADPKNQTPDLTYRALELGALALQVKPALDAGAESWNLAKEVKLLSSVRVIRHFRRRGVAKPAEGESSFAASSIGLLAIASSTGGPQVIHKLFSELPSDFPAPIVVVQHINGAFAESLAGWLSASTPLRVKLAKDGDALVPGTVLLAPPGQHLVVPARGKVGLLPGGPRDGHVPSASMLLESAAKAYGRRCTGLVLTGMGTDGAEGMAAIKSLGGRTLIQSEESCVVFGMPGAALAKKAVDYVVHADELSSALLTLARGEILPERMSVPLKS